MRSIDRWQFRARRPFFTGAAFAILAVGLLLFPPVRAAADQLLQLFRVQSVMFVPTSPERIRQLQNLDFDKETLFVAKPQVVNQPAPPRTVGSIAEAAKSLSFTPVQPTQLPAAPASTELKVIDRQVGQFQVNVAAARQLLSLMNVDDVTIPDTLGSAPIVVDLQPALEAHYRGDDYDLELLQGVSPTVKLPDGVNLPQLGKAALRLLGMDPARAEAVSQSVNWSSTLLFPFPADAQDIRQVTVGDAPGLLVGNATGSGQRWQMYWQQGDRFYVLQSRNLNETEMFQVADSIH